MLPSWNPTYSVNHTIIDKQHQKLFKLAAKVYSLSSHEFTKERVRELILDFYSYMQTHFSDEEEYMEQIKYPKLEEHKVQHQKLIDSMNDILRKSHNYQAMRETMKELVKQWLIVHILQEDMEYEVWRKNNRTIDLNPDNSNDEITENI